MSKIKKALSTIGLTLAGVVMVAGSAFAAGGCPDDFNAKGQQDDANGYSIRCTGVSKDTIEKVLGTTFTGSQKAEIWVKDQSDCTKLGAASTSNPCEGKDLNNMIHIIINTVIFILGMIAVIVIIIGGVFYAISAGDPGKVKKAKDTIMYGIIGLIVALLASAIVNFVLGSLFA